VESLLSQLHTLTIQVAELKAQAAAKPAKREEAKDLLKPKAPSPYKGTLGKDEELIDAWLFSLDV
jgi:hypothetical protein